MIKAGQTDISNNKEDNRRCQPSVPVCRFFQFPPFSVFISVN